MQGTCTDRKERPGKTASELKARYGDGAKGSITSRTPFLSTHEWNSTQAPQIDSQQSRFLWANTLRGKNSAKSHASNCLSLEVSCSFRGTLMAANSLVPLPSHRQAASSYQELKTHASSSSPRVTLIKPILHAECPFPTWPSWRF